MQTSALQVVIDFRFICSAALYLVYTGSVIYINDGERGRKVLCPSIRLHVLLEWRNLTTLLQHKAVTFCLYTQGVALGYMLLPFQGVLLLGSRVIDKQQ